MNMKTEDLEGLFKTHRGDPAVLRQLLLELDCREKPRALELRKKVHAALWGAEGDGCLGNGATAAAQPSRENFRREAALPRLDLAVPLAFGIPAAPAEQGELLEALRATFTPRGELLARWGMTELLPAEIIAIVFVEWKRLLQRPDFPRDRQLKDLELDIARLSNSEWPRTDKREFKE